MGAESLFFVICGERKFISSSQSAQRMIDIFVKYAEIYFDRREILWLLLTNLKIYGIL